MKKFIVIEGDNGTGKDTLAEQIKTLGYEVITYAEKIKIAEKKARTLSGGDRVLSFLEYNQLCGLNAELSNMPCLLIRYWISTLAAAYADQIWSLETINIQISHCISQFPTPDLVFQMKCDFSVRNSRVASRGTPDDNMCPERDKRYSLALDEIRNKLLPFTAWEVIDTTKYLQLQVFQKAQEILTHLSHLTPNQKHPNKHYIPELCPKEFYPS